MLALAWLTLFGLAYWFFDDWEKRQANPNRELALRSQGGEVALERNRAGQYVAEGEINGSRVVFLLDTGATQVALSTRLAKRLGAPLGGVVTVRTANGTVTGYQTRLERVRLGPIEMRDVAALASAGIDDDTVLLGMSFLKRIEFTQSGDRLILRPSTAAK